MDIQSLTAILWTTFGIFIVLALIIVLGMTTSLVLKCQRKVVTETRKVETSSFNADVAKEERAEQI